MWKSYQRNDGRYRWQMDGAIALGSYAIGAAAEELDFDAERPWWMRKINHVPCDCGVCWFCKHGKTGSVGHFVRAHTPVPMVAVLDSPVSPIQASEAGASAAQKRRKRESMSGEEVERSHAGEKREKVRENQQICAACRQGIKAFSKEHEKGWKDGQVRRRCKSTNLGCLACDKVVCAECWPYWSHQTQTSERDFSGVQ